MLGYEETKDYNFDAHGELVFQKGNRFISPDNTGHGGAHWKMYQKGIGRVGTFTKYLDKMVRP